MHRNFALAALSSSLVALLACSSRPVDRRQSAASGADAGQPSSNAPGSVDPGSDNPQDDPPEQPGGDDDAGTATGGDGSGDTGTNADGGDSATGGAACVAAKSGWRSMAPVPTAATTALRGFMDTAWSGRQMFTVHRWYDRCTGAGCTPHDEAFAYDPVKDAWRALPAPPGSPARAYNYGLSLDGKWVLFESTVTKVAGSTLEGAVYDPLTNAWTTFGAAPVAKRSGFALVAATTTHELVFWGGVNESSSGDALFADGAAFSLATHTWRTIAPSPLPAGASNVTTWDGARMNVVFPKQVGDGEYPQSAAAAYDPATDAWTTLPLPAAHPRVMASSAAIPRGAGLMPTAMFGGVDFLGEEPRPDFRDGAWLDPTTSTWSAIPDPGTALLPADTDWRTAFGANGRLYVWGGRTSTSTSSADVSTGMAYDLAAGTWSAMPTAGAPTAREGAVAVWTGCDAIVLGGIGIGTTTTMDLDDGALFRPE